MASEKRRAVSDLCVLSQRLTPGIDSLRNAGFVRTLKWALPAALLFLLPSVAVDYFYYGRPVVAIWNIVRHSVLCMHAQNTKHTSVQTRLANVLTQALQTRPTPLTRPPPLTLTHLGFL